MVTQEIARKLSILAGDTVRIIYKPVAWSELLDLPAKGSVDMIISSITSLPEREVTHKLRFTKPYYRTTLSWISTDAKVLANPFLKDNVIGVQAGTTSENVAKATIAAVEDQSRPKIQTFEQNVIALEQLQRPSAPIALVLADTPFAEAEARKSESGASEKLLTRVVVENDFPEPSRKSIALGEPYAIATSSIDSDLLTVINNSIEFIEKNGQLAELEHAARDQYNDTLN
jgi:ABC-type amino acid transport substrate-binding protein